MMSGRDSAVGSDCKIAAAILAGGQASRFGGRPKGALRLHGGASIMDNTLAAVAEAGISRVALIANDPEPYHHLGMEIVSDRRPGRGPLGGIETALLHFAAKCEAILILPCDLPGLTHREIGALRAGFEATRPPVAVAATGDGFWHPLCAILRTDLLPAVSRALDAGRNGVCQLWRTVGALPVWFEDPAPFYNINSSEDLVRWLRGQNDLPPAREPARLLR